MRAAYNIPKWGCLHRAKISNLGAMKMLRKSGSGIGPSVAAYEPACSVDVLANFIFTIYGREALQFAIQS